MANDTDAVSIRLRQLERTADDHETRIRANREITAQVPRMLSDIKDIKNSCDTIRNWVEEREEAKEKMSAGQKGIVTAGVFALAAATVALIGQLIAAGVL